MSGKRASAKHKIDRRLGVNLWGRQKSPYNLRQTGPGMHGGRRSKPTDYGTQLAAKQKLKGYYGSIGEKQFRRYFKEATRLRGDTGQNLIGLLERRLDAVIYFDMITESESNLWNLLSSPLTYPRLTSSAFHAILEPNITRTHNVGYKLKYMDAKCIRSLFSPSAMPTHV